MNINDTGMAKPMTDEDYFNLMTDGGTNEDKVLVLCELYPELLVFVK